MGEKEIMSEYRITMAVVQLALRKRELEEDPFKALLEPAHPLATSDLFPRARNAWAVAAEVCGNLEMAAHIRGVESMVVALRGK